MGMLLAPAFAYVTSLAGTLVLVWATVQECAEGSVVVSVLILGGSKIIMEGLFFLNLVFDIRRRNRKIEEILSSQRPPNPRETGSPN